VVVGGVEAQPSTAPKHAMSKTSAVLCLIASASAARNGHLIQKRLEKAGGPAHDLRSVTTRSEAFGGVPGGERSEPLTSHERRTSACRHPEGSALSTPGEKEWCRRGKCVRPLSAPVAAVEQIRSRARRQGAPRSRAPAQEPRS